MAPPSNSRPNRDGFVRRIVKTEKRRATGPARGDYEVLYLSCGHTEWRTDDTTLTQCSSPMSGQHKQFSYRRCYYCKLGFPLPAGATSEPDVQCDAEVDHAVDLREDADDPG